MERRNITHLVWLPWLLVLSLLCVLSACGSTGAPGATAASTQTVATPSAQSNTPPVQPSASNTAVSKPHEALTALRMLDSNNGWALSSSSILRTTDGGVHWKDVTPANAGLNQNGMGQFMNMQYAWVAIEPANQQEGPGITILRTTDGGISWQRSLINDPLVSLVDVPHFINAKQGWLEMSSTPGAGSARSDLWHSNDGGLTWSELSSNKSSSGLNLGYVTGISFENAQVGIAVGNLGAGGDNTVPSVSLTQNGGKTWQTRSLPHLLGGYVNPSNTSQPPVFFGNVVFLPVNVTLPNDNLLVLYRSTDGGLNWVQTSASHIRAQNTYVLDTSHAWATDSQSGKLYNTIDGGDHWTLTSNTAFALNALSFTDAQTGWGLTRDQLLHTTDGGKTWQQIPYSIQ